MAKTYQKIPGVGTGRGSLQVASRSRLYTAADHLLIVQSTGYTEEYKRIFFRDIRYVDVRKTKLQGRIAVGTAIVTLLLALFYFAGLPILLVALFCSPFVIWFIVNIVRGPTCECYISTNVQTLKLPAPRRMNKVATLINYLRSRMAEFDPAAAPQPTV
jgi:hypothetical protein